jgi:ribonuclease J
MLLNIHRGTSEIGGTCIELQSGETRIILDLGLPLDSASNSESNPINQKIVEIANSSNGIIISHTHLDHFGLIYSISNEIPIWLSKASHKIIGINRIFQNKNIAISNPHYFENEKPFKIGGFTVTPYLNDHSAFDSYSFLVEAEGKRLFYTGDFRNHGRKASLFRKIITHPPKNIDYLLVEGTTIGRTQDNFVTEDDIKNLFIEIFKESQGINLIYTSSQNIDRIVSIYKACLTSRKTLILDVYTAEILDCLSEFSKLPTPLKGFSNLRVFYPEYLLQKFIKLGHNLLIEKYSKASISISEISNKPSSYVMLVRPSMKIDLEKINFMCGNLLYSMWNGYKEQPFTKEFINWLVSKNLKTIDIHTSGHASVSTLKMFADALNPSKIIPIHTQYSSAYSNIFNQNILVLHDNEKFNL